MPSRYQGTPIALLEAPRWHVHLAATGGIPLVQHEEHALLVPPGDAMGSHRDFRDNLGSRICQKTWTKRPKEDSAKLQPRVSSQRHVASLPKSPEETQFAGEIDVFWPIRNRK